MMFAMNPNDALAAIQAEMNRSETALLDRGFPADQWEPLREFIGAAIGFHVIQIARQTEHGSAPPKADGG